MRTVVHLSDLHFGRADSRLVQPLLAAVNGIHADLICVSGDLTQHASEIEFLQARSFLEQLRGVRIVVPGNHDLSFYNPWLRLTQRLRLYKRLITNDLEPVYRDPELVAAGLNTARVPLFRGGRFSASQMNKVENHMREAGGAVRLLVTHHPFDLPPGYAARDFVYGARRNMARLLASVDVLLAGHHHLSHSGATAQRYRVEGLSAVFVQAGTALSERRRGECNSFNVLRLDRSQISVTPHTWSAGTAQFEPGETHVFRRTSSAWVPV